MEHTIELAAPDADVVTTDPAVELADLRDIDVVLLSHFHGDHFDRVAQEQLPRSVPVVTTC